MPADDASAGGCRASAAAARRASPPRRPNLDRGATGAGPPNEQLALCAELVPVLRMTLLDACTLVEVPLFTHADCLLSRLASPASDQTKTGGNSSPNREATRPIGRRARGRAGEWEGGHDGLGAGAAGRAPASRREGASALPGPRRTGPTGSHDQGLASTAAPPSRQEPRVSEGETRTNGLAGVRVGPDDDDQDAVVVGAAADDRPRLGAALDVHVELDQVARRPGGAASAPRC